MPSTLSAADVARYARDGFLSPNRALTPAEAAGYRARLEAFERAIGGPLTADATSRHLRRLSGRVRRAGHDGPVSVIIVRHSTKERVLLLEAPAEEHGLGPDGMISELLDPRDTARRPSA